MGEGGGGASGGRGRRGEGEGHGQASSERGPAVSSVKPEVGDSSPRSR
jgi:hypothetical protein